MLSDTPAPPEAAADIELLCAWIEARMAYRGEPGLSIAIVHDQELVWARGFGYADLANRVAASADTRYRIASVTKLFTSTAILLLRDAGKLQLDDPVARHLPWFEIRQRHSEAEPVTIRHLLTHTSGLPREAAFPYWTDARFPSRAQVRERLPQQESAYPAATRWKYSNLALALAGEIVAAVSGRPWEEFVQQRILDPLGMNDTLTGPPRPDDPRLAAGYGRRLPGEERAVLDSATDYAGIACAANMTSTVADLAKFTQLQFRDGPAGGAQILRGSTLREMQRVHWLDPDWTQGWGLGFKVIRGRGVTCIGHSGRVPGHRTQVLLCPAARTGVIVIGNAGDCDPMRYCERAFELALPAVTEKRRSGTAAGASGSRLAALRRQVPRRLVRHPGDDPQRRAGDAGPHGGRTAGYPRHADAGRRARVPLRVRRRLRPGGRTGGVRVGRRRQGAAAEVRRELHLAGSLLGLSHAACDRHGRSCR